MRPGTREESRTHHAFPCSYSSLPKISHYHSCQLLPQTKVLDSSKDVYFIPCYLVHTVPPSSQHLFSERHHANPPWEQPRENLPEMREFNRLFSQPIGSLHLVGYRFSQLPQKTLETHQHVLREQSNTRLLWRNSYKES